MNNEGVIFLSFLFLGQFVRQSIWVVHLGSPFESPLGQSIWQSIWGSPWTGGQRNVPTLTFQIVGGQADLYWQSLYPYWSKFHDLEYSKSEQDTVGQKMERMLEMSFGSVQSLAGISFDGFFIQSQETYQSEP